MSHPNQTSAVWKCLCFPPVLNDMIFPLCYNVCSWYFEFLTRSRRPCHVCLFRNWWIHGEDRKSTDGKDFRGNETKDVPGDIASSRNSAVYGTHMLFPPLCFLFLSGLFSFSFSSECSCCSSSPYKPLSLSLTHLTLRTLSPSLDSADVEPLHPPASFSHQTFPLVHCPLFQSSPAESRTAHRRSTPVPTELHRPVPISSD